MSYALIIFIALLQNPAKGKPIEAPPKIDTSSGITFTLPAHPEPVISFHMTESDPILLEIKLPNGKQLLVTRDGSVSGDLAKDEAAKEFWKAFAAAYPEICTERNKK